MRGFNSVPVVLLVIFSIQDGYGKWFLPHKHARADVECPPGGGLLTNPDDCSTFYECSDNKPILQHCPTNLLFCSELNSCQYITSDQCSYSDCKLPDSTDSTTQTTTTEVTTTQSTTTTEETTTQSSTTTTSEPLTTSTTTTETSTSTTTEPTTTPSTTSTPLTSTTSRPTTTTTPDTTTSESNALCPPPAGNPTNLVPDPDDCRAFYECIGDNAIREYCPEPLWFCNEEHICTYQDDSLCRFDYCKKVDTMSVVMADPPTCPPPSGQGNVTLYPNAENCSTYYECDNGVLQTLDCPKGLLFCSEKSACSWSWDTECAHSDCELVQLYKSDDGNDVATIQSATKEHETIAETIITCPSTDERRNPYIPDPTNCSFFYECVGKVPIHEECPPDLVFCPNKGVCSFAWDEYCGFGDCKNVVPDELIQPASKEHEIIADIIICPMHEECPPPLVFCPGLATCTFSWSEDCELEHCKKFNVVPGELIREDETTVKEDETTTADPTSTSTEEPINCENTGELFVNPEDCSTYYECNENFPILMKCPLTLLFCTENKDCSYRMDSRCSFKDCKLPE